MISCFRLLELLSELEVNSSFVRASIVKTVAVIKSYHPQHGNLQANPESEGFIEAALEVEGVDGFAGQPGVAGVGEQNPDQLLLDNGELKLQVVN